MYMKTIREYIGNNSYPGRGILVGMTKDNKAVVGYFISLSLIHISEPTRP